MNSTLIYQQLQQAKSIKCQIFEGTEEHKKSMLAFYVKLRVIQIVSPCKLISKYLSLLCLPQQAQD